MVSGRAVALALLALLPSLLLPVAASAGVSEGAFVIHGPLHLPPATSLESTLLALYQNETANLSMLRVDASRMHVRLVELKFVDTLPLTWAEISTTNWSWWLTDTHLQIVDGDSSGVIGFYPGSASVAQFHSLGTMTVEAREVSEIGSLQQASPGNAYDPFYFKRVMEPHFYVETPGTVSISGQGAVKIVGPDVEILAKENQTTFETGLFSTSPLEKVYRWLELTYEGTTEIGSGAESLKAAVRGGREIHWDGPLQITPVAGEIRTGRTAYTAAGEPATLSGTFSATILPVGGRTSTAEMRDIQGDLRATTLPSMELPSGTSSVLGITIPFWPWTPIGVLLPVVAGLAVLAWRSSRAQERIAPAREPDATARPVLPAPASSVTPLTTLLSLASEAEEDEDWRFALGSLQAARRLAPRDYDLAMREATCRRNLGDHKAALACYEEAALLKDTGEPYYWAAVLSVRMDDVALAKQYAEAALARDPTLAADLASDDLFRGVWVPERAPDQPDS